MHAMVHSVALTGVDAIDVSVEASIAGGLPGLYVVGLPDAAVREARERVRAALRSLRLPLPASRVVVNLAPADVRKQGPAFDLPIALALLAAQAKVPLTRLRRAVIVGELGLDGRLRPVPGVLAVALAARRRDDATLVVPAAQAAGAAAVEGLEVVGVSSLAEAIAWARGEPLPHSVPAPGSTALPFDAPDLADVRGHVVAKRALEVAAAGRHHLLLSGPPGSGKTMLAERLPWLLPPLPEAAALEVARLHSLAGLDSAGASPRPQRLPPLRAPHHSLSLPGLTGTPTSLGELSLAHRGVLFLDELPEFDRRALEALREPLASGWIELARANARRRLPADVQLVAAMNPCPCGHAGDPLRPCRCLPSERRRYLARLSGPLLDRIAIRLVVSGSEQAPAGTRERDGAGSSATVAVRVARAQALARERQGCLNGALRGAQLARHAALPSAGERILAAARRSGRLGERGVDDVTRVARTLADLAGRAAVQEEDVAEALVYRAEVAPVSSLRADAERS